MDSHRFKLKSGFQPKGSQPEAIAKLSSGLEKGFKAQTLLGVTGSGKSLDFNELIFLKDKSGYIRKYRIGEFVDAHLSSPKRIGDTEYQAIAGFKVASFDPVSHDVGEAEITEVSRHVDKTVYEVLLDDGSTVRVTGGHNFFRFRDGTFELCATIGLKVGDAVPTLLQPLEPSNFVRTVNFLDFCPGRKINVSKLIARFDKNASILHGVLSGHFRAPRWKISQIMAETKDRGLNAEQFGEYVKALGLDFSEAAAHATIITKGRDALPCVIPLTDDLVAFTGLYVSEGHAEDTYVMISNSSESLQDHCVSFFSRYGLGWNRRNRVDVQYNSYVMARFFESFGGIAREKRVPSLFYNLTDKQLSIFIRSVFDGDGYVEGGGVGLTSASRELVNDLRNLLLRFGVVGRVREKRVKGKVYYILAISGRDNLKRFQERVSFSLGYKKEKLGKIIRDDANTNVDLIPNSSGLVKSVRRELHLSQKEFAKVCGCTRSHVSFIENGKRSPSRELFSRLTAWLDRNAHAFAGLGSILSFNLRTIKRIARMNSHNGRVYDLSVEKTENFAAGMGGIFVHNTFTMANVIERVQKPTLVIAHNKTLAAQLFEEFKEFFPENRVEYFVSYYDYYQPESYIPQKDQYIEKDAQVNPKIEAMRLSATASLLSRPDTIVVASVSCIYGLGNPANFKGLGFELARGQEIGRRQILAKLIGIQFERNDTELMPGRFRVKGEVIDLMPGYYDSVIRVELSGDRIDRIREINKMTGEVLADHKYFFVYPARHFVTPEADKKRALVSIREELEVRLPEMDMIEAHRLKQRTLYDLELIEETGTCKGIENYSRHFDGRKAGDKPYCLLDYFPEGFLLIIDESHQTVPQLHGMFHGDRSRKQALVDYGFRLPSAYDNRPLRFEEFETYMNNVVFVSATPAEYEYEHSAQVVEQIIRPTGLVDPPIEVRPIKGQILDLLTEIEKTVKKGNRVLVTTLTKKLAEELSDFLAEKKVKARYLHSEVDTLQRTEIIRQLRLGKYDVLVGINLLREGLDIPEVGFIGILDADKEGFLRDSRSIIQTVGRAARNVDSHVVLYADVMTDSIKDAISETERRRKIQLEFNEKNGITPKTIIKPIREREVVELTDSKHVPKAEIPNLLIELEEAMKKAAEELDFERAIGIRDRLKKLNERLSGKSDKA